MKDGSGTCASFRAARTRMKHRMAILKRDSLKDAISEMCGQKVKKLENWCFDKTKHFYSMARKIKRMALLHSSAVGSTKSSQQEQLSQLTGHYTKVFPINRPVNWSVVCRAPDFFRFGPSAPST